MKRQYLSTSLSLALTLFAGRASAEAATAPPTFRNTHELMVHGFRSPSIGLEYRAGYIGVHMGAYTTILARDAKSPSEATWFFKTGMTAYLLPIRLTSARHSSFFVSGAYLRGLEHGWRSAAFLDAGFRWAAWKGLDVRLGVGVLLSPDHGVRVNPTPGISWSFPLPR